MKALDAMLPANAGERRTLADIIFSKLDNLEAGKPDVSHEKQRGKSRMLLIHLRDYPQWIPCWLEIPGYQHLVGLAGL